MSNFAQGKQLFGALKLKSQKNSSVENWKNFFPQVIKIFFFEIVYLNLLICTVFQKKLRKCQKSQKK